MTGISRGSGEVLQLLWDETPVTTKETQAGLALIEQHLSSLILYYSRQRKATALEQVKKYREQGKDKAYFNSGQTEEERETPY